METTAYNALIEIKDQFTKAFKKAFKEIPEDNLDSLTKLYGKFQLYFQIAKEVDSYRHLRLLIPQLLKELEQGFDIKFDLPDKFVELMTAQLS